MPPPATPRSADQVTLDWLNQALREATAGSSISDFSIDAVGDLDGFLSDLVRIRLSYADGDAAREDVPRSVIAKFPSQKQDERDLGDSFSAYEREVMFYRHASKGIPCNPPSHYHSVAGPEFVLLIEDLGGARFVKQTDGVQREDALDIVRSLASLHARYWETQELEAMNWLPSFSEFARIYPPEIETGWPQLSSDFDYLIPSDMRDLFPVANNAHPRIVHHLCERPATLVHCDPRIENFAFEEGSGPERVRLYDWQLVCRGPAAYDLMYFMVQSIDADVRRGFEKELLETYYDTLVSHGVSDYGFEELRQDMGTSACMMWGFLSAVGNIVHPDEKGREIMERTAPRFFELMRDLGAPERILSFL